MLKNVFQRTKLQHPVQVKLFTRNPDTQKIRLLWESYFCAKTLIISGQECCKQNTDCEKHEQCSGENCIAACDLKTCGRNTNCIPKDHRANCTCTNGYIKDQARSGCYRGKRIQCNFCLCTSNLHRMKLLHSLFY